jgi:SAM-dependent methyltransferase
MKKSILIITLSLTIVAAIVGLKVQKTPEIQTDKPVDHVTIAILAKDKAHTLPLYLSCLEKQTWPAEKSYLYIRTNNNNDNTAEILRDWVAKVGSNYAGVYFDDTDVKETVQNYKPHEWNSIRFKVLGKIRQESVDYAKTHNSHYFVADCDNFIQPCTIEKLVETNLPIVAPLLRLADPHPYSNYHAAIDVNGYFADSPYYHAILNRSISGLIELPVVHCSYLIQNNVLDKISYDDESYRYEYVIFSDSARKNNIPQYIDNRELYGRMTFAETKEEFEKEPWIEEFQTTHEKISSVFTGIYKNAVWGTNENGKGHSGNGSTAKNTKPYRNYLTEFMKENHVKSVVDIGCGDWEFSQLIDWRGINYTGFDVVKDVIEHNNKTHSNSHVKFVNDNFLTADLPEADLLICKDVFQHLSNDEILAFMPKLKKFKHCLFTNDTNPLTDTCENHNIRIGGYRPLDLTEAPFNIKGEKAFHFISEMVKKQILHVMPQASTDENFASN